MLSDLSIRQQEQTRSPLRTVNKDLGSRWRAAAARTRESKPVGLPATRSKPDFGMR